VFWIRNFFYIQIRFSPLFWIRTYGIGILLDFEIFKDHILDPILNMQQIPILFLYENGFYIFYDFILVKENLLVPYFNISNNLLVPYFITSSKVGIEPT
jgi:hypothetical protein